MSDLVGLEEQSYVTPNFQAIPVSTVASTQDLVALISNLKGRKQQRRPMLYLLTSGSGQVALGHLGQHGEQGTLMTEEQVSGMLSDAVSSGSTSASLTLTSQPHDNLDSGGQVQGTSTSQNPSTTGAGGSEGGKRSSTTTQDQDDCCVECCPIAAAEAVVTHPTPQRSSPNKKRKLADTKSAVQVCHNPCCDVNLPSYSQGSQASMSAGAAVAYTCCHTPEPPAGSRNSQQMDHFAHAAACCPPYIPGMMFGGFLNGFDQAYHNLPLHSNHFASAFRPQNYPTYACNEIHPHSSYFPPNAHHSIAQDPYVHFLACCLPEHTPGEYVGMTNRDEAHRISMSQPSSYSPPPIPQPRSDPQENPISQLQSASGQVSMQSHQSNMPQQALIDGSTSNRASNEQRNMQASDSMTQTNESSYRKTMQQSSADDEAYLQCLWAACFASFPTTDELIAHLSESHIDQSGGNQTTCHWSECEQQTSAPHALMSHLCHDHLGTTELRHECQWKGCNARFQTFDALTEHVSESHVGQGRSSYMCEWRGCERGGRPFTQRQKIMRHIQTHTGDKPYQCNICKKRFSESNIMTQHMRTHTGEKPYRCIECGRDFSISAALTIHRRVHTGEKPFKCKFEGCDKRFAESSNLTKHMRVHTGERPFKCPDPTCDKRFSRPDQLNRHQRRHQVAGHLKV